MKRENKLLDILKYAAALLVLASHCLPIVQNESINFFYGQWFFRFCVPFFIISSGYFFASFQEKGRITYIKRIAVLYLVSSLLYLPAYIKAGAGVFLKNLIFGGYHLWYLSALVIALSIWFILEKCPFVNNIFKKAYPIICVILLCIGVYYDEYQHVFEIPLLERAGTYIGYIGGSRHALFFVLPMLLIGRFLFEHKRVMKLSKATCIMMTIACFAVSFAECVGLRYYVGEYITCDVTFFNFLPAIFLFILTFVWQPKLLDNISTKSLRKNADVIYIIHILVLFVVDLIFDVTYMYRLLLVLIVSIIVSQVYLKLSDIIKSKIKSKH